jgi:orotidine-5'-phosphate decarboxylase
MRRETGLVLALDETDGDRALWVADQVRDLVDAIKVNWPLVLSTSPDIIGELARRAEVICDFKVADIPNTTRLIVEGALERGASAVIVHGFPGADSLRAAVEAAGMMEIYVVVEMSHPGGEEFTHPVADRMARMAVREGAAGVIAPATRPARIAEIRRIVGSLRILSPGVGAQGGRAREAIRMGADHVIVGRSIYGAEDPRGAAEAICDEIKAVL